MAMRGIFQDWQANRANPKGRTLLILFRIAAHAHRWPRAVRWLAWPYLLLYRIATESLFGCELPPSVEAGPGLCIRHAFAMVINRNVRIGADVELFHGVTLGTDGWGTGAVPRIEDGVVVYAHAQIVGGVTIGARTRVGAGAVVTRDLPADVVAAGNPARVLRRLRHVEVEMAVTPRSQSSPTTLFVPALSLDPRRRAGQAHEPGADQIA